MMPDSRCTEYGSFDHSVIIVLVSYISYAYQIHLFIHGTVLYAHYESMIVMSSVFYLQFVVYILEDIVVEVGVRTIAQATFA